MATNPDDSPVRPPVSDARFRQMLEQAVIGVLSVDYAMRIDYVNAHMAHLLRWRASELVGLTLFDLVFPDDQDSLACLVERRRHGVSEQFDFRFRTRDGSALWAQVSTNPVFAEDGRFIGATAMVSDLTERRRMEEALRQSEERFKWAAYATSDALYEWDVQAGSISWNMGVHSLTGRPENGRLDIAWWTEQIHPAHRSRVVRSLEDAMASGDDYWTEEYPFLRQDGSYADVRDRGYFLRDAAGHVTRMIGAMEDQTERKRAEEAQVELRAREQAAKAELEAYRELDRLKSQFVNAVSHELRTPLTSMMGYAEFLEDELGGALSETQREFVAQIQRGSRRLEHLLDDLLDFARLDANTFRLVYQEEDLGAKVDEVIRSLRPQAQDSGVALSWRRPPAPALLMMDGHRIEQVLLNLIGNALKFTPRGGRVEVRLFREPAELGVEVQDSGPGIDPADQAKLFRRFSQLSAGSQRGGTGLGLAISKALVEAHHGSIGLRSVPGEGSVFWFRLPLDAPTRMGLDTGAERRV